MMFVCLVFLVVTKGEKMRQSKIKAKRRLKRKEKENKKAFYFDEFYSEASTFNLLYILIFLFSTTIAVSFVITRLSYV